MAKKDNQEIDFQYVVSMQLIKQTWTEYTKFIGKPGIAFPSNITLKFPNTIDENSTIKELSHFNYIGNDSFELLVEQAVVRDKPTLYHEFTHVINIDILNCSFETDDFLNIYSAITENRADYIMYMFKYGLKSISDTTILTNSIINENVDSVQKKLKEQLISINPQNITDEEMKQKLIFVLKQIQYYIGFYLFVKKHTNVPINNEDILSQASELFGDNIVKFFQLADKIPLSMKEINEDEIQFAEEYSKIFRRCYIYYCSKFQREKTANNTDAFSILGNIISNFFSQ